MPPSRLPRHAAAETSRRRAVLPPAVLLSAAAIAFGGLAVMPAETSTVRLTAASASSPIVLGAAPSQADFDTLYGIAPKEAAAKAPARPAARASRGNRTPVAAKPATPKVKWARPNIGRLTSGYKWRWGRMHTGIDIAGPYGSPVRSVGAGTVISAGYEGGYGKLVKVRHDDDTVTYYAHNSRLLVAAGERVAAGEVIAAEGSTGHSTGPHVHFEVRINGNPVNPIPWLAKRGIYL